MTDDCVFTLRARIQLLQDCNFQMRLEIKALEDALEEEKVRVMQLTQDILNFKAEREGKKLLATRGR